MSVILLDWFLCHRPPQSSKAERHLNGINVILCTFTSTEREGIFSVVVVFLVFRKSIACTSLVWQDLNSANSSQWGPQNRSTGELLKSIVVKVCPAFTRKERKASSRQCHNSELTELISSEKLTEIRLQNRINVKMHMQ